MGRAAGRTLNRGQYLQLRTAGLGTVDVVSNTDDAALEGALGTTDAVAPLRAAVRRHQEIQKERAELTEVLGNEAA